VGERNGAVGPHLRVEVSDQGSDKVGNGNAARARRVLVVEDQPLIRLLLVDSLADAGFDVVEAENGDGAIGVLQGLDDIALLVTDLQMPGATDGNAVAAAARSRYPDVAVIYMTGRPDSLLHPLSGRDVLMIKPFKPSDILKTADRLLAHERSACAGVRSLL
jgi:CheY-like chemotaxis protein